MIGYSGIAGSTEQEIICLSDKNFIISKKTKGRKIMDIKLVKKLIDDLKDNLGDALLMSDISSFKVGSSVASHNANPKTAALVNKFSKYLIEMINKAGVGDSCSYYACEVEGGIMMPLLPLQHRLIEEYIVFTAALSTHTQTSQPHHE